MRFLTDRKDIGMALNFGKNPVIMFDLDRPKDGYEGTFEGTLVRVDCGNFRDGERYLTVSTPTIFLDMDDWRLNGRSACMGADISVMAHPCVVSSSFGASDVIEQAKGAMAPIIKAGEDVVVIYTWNYGRDCLVRVMRCGNVSRHTFPIMKITD